MKVMYTENPFPIAHNKLYTFNTLVCVSISTYAKDPFIRIRLQKVHHVICTLGFNTCIYNVDAFSFLMFA